MCMSCFHTDNGRIDNQSFSLENNNDFSKPHPLNVTFSPQTVEKHDLGTDIKQPIAL